MPATGFDENPCFGEACRVKLEKHIHVQGSEDNAVVLLHKASGLSKGAIKQAMTKGAVWLGRGSHTRRVRRTDTKLRPGDQLHLYYDEDILEQAPGVAVLIADEQDYSIWHKPFGMRSQGSRWGDHCTINRWVETHLAPQRPAFLTHRLDRAATGLMIIAHRKRTAAGFAELFRRRVIEKTYRARVCGHFPGSQTLKTPIEQKTAVSHVRLVRYIATLDESLVDVDIETGRKHQIRRHLAHAGFPVVGDKLYGSGSVPTEKNLCLTAYQLSFTAPNGTGDKRYVLPPELMNPDLR